MGHFSVQVERPTLNSNKQDGDNPYDGHVVVGGEFIKIDSTGVQTNLDVDEEVQEEESNGGTRNRSNLS